MPKYLQERQKQIWAFSGNFSTEKNIAALLVKMAIYRQAQWDSPKTLKLYTQALIGLEDMRGLQTAIAMLGETKREEGQTALPSLGEILEAYDECREFFPDVANGKKKIDTQPLIAGPEQRKLTS